MRAVSDLGVAKRLSKVWDRWDEGQWLVWELRHRGGGSDTCGLVMAVNVRTGVALAQKLYGEGFYCGTLDEAASEVCAPLACRGGTLEHGHLSARCSMLDLRGEPYERI